MVILTKERHRYARVYRRFLMECLFSIFIKYLSRREGLSIRYRVKFGLYLVFIPSNFMTCYGGREKNGLKKPLKIKAFSVCEYVNNIN